MKKLICLLTLLVGSFAFSGAHADNNYVNGGDNFYAGVFGGANWAHNSGHHHNHIRTGYLLGLDVGYKWCNGLRTEFEFSYRSNQNKRHHHSSGETYEDSESSSSSHRHQNYAGLFNILYDFDAWGCWCVRPFIGGGIGVASTKRHHGGDSESSSSSSRKSSFAWQLIAGLAYPLNDCVDIDLSYRFFRTSEEKTNNNGLALGLNYNF